MTYRNSYLTPLEKLDFCFEATTASRLEFVLRQLGSGPGITG